MCVEGGGPGSCILWPCKAGLILGIRVGRPGGAWDATSTSSCLLSLYFLCLLHLSPSFLLPRLSSLLALPFP